MASQLFLDDDVSSFSDVCLAINGRSLLSSTEPNDSLSTSAFSFKALTDELNGVELWELDRSSRGQKEFDSTRLGADDSDDDEDDLGMSMAARLGAGSSAQSLKRNTSLMLCGGFKTRVTQHVSPVGRLTWIFAQPEQ